MRKNLVARLLCSGALCFALSNPALAQTIEEVGDLDSFGRNVIYLGSAQTAPVTLLPDCTPDPADPPDSLSRCLTLNAAPAATSFDESNLASIRLPGRSSRSLLCFSLTPLVNYSFDNQTGIPRHASFTARAVLTLESTVLNDPTLIDPNTGLPYGGKLVFPLSTYSESHSIGAGERERKQMTLSRHCIGGLVSKNYLRTAYGLSATQAELFFARPIKLTFGASGTVQMADFVSYFYGIRLYGDR